MAEKVITRTQIITIGEVRENDYKDLVFTDKEGGEYKIGVKRRQYFDKVIIPDMAVQLNYAEAYKKEYIYSAVQVKDGLPPPQKPQTPAPHLDEPRELPTKYAPQEIGMWMKELGECIRSGQLEKDYPKFHIKIKGYYYKKMSEVTGVPFKE